MNAQIDQCQIDTAVTWGLILSLSIDKNGI